MTFINKILKEPLFHFLVFGFLLFLFWGYFRAEAGDEKTIVVDKKALTEMLQFESKAFNDEVFGDKLAKMSEAEKKNLIGQYIREEVLHREAVKMGLDKNDYVIKRRVNQKIEFLYENLAEENAASPTDENLQKFYEANKNRYAKPSLLTFTHIFFKAESEADFAEAKQKAESFQTAGIGFEESLKYGDRFLYHKNYIDRDLEYISSQFGKDFAENVSKLEPSETFWSQPIKSEHGFHLVLLTAKQQSGFAAFAEVREKVLDDYKLDEKNKARDKKIEELIKQYDVRITVF
jgi:parvulin-like peptidyl-prolyl isomerase